MDLIILDKNFRKVDVLDEYESLIWTDRYHQYGDFEVYASASKDLIDKMKMDYYLQSQESEHLMIIEDTILETNVELGSHFTVTGRSLESIIDRRIVWNQTVLDGYLQGQVKKMLENNVINPVDPKRKISNFIFEETTDPVITSLKLTAQYTGDNLYEVISKICLDQNIGFKITLNSKNQFVFKLYAGSDRSYKQFKNPHVVFSPKYENLINSKRIQSKKSLKNVALVAGEGEGSSRKTLTTGNTTVTGLDRREMFVDARDISSTTENGGTVSESTYNQYLKQRGDERLSQNKSSEVFDGQVDTTQMYRYGEHFFMGDICQIENEYEIGARVRVLEFIYSESTNGIENYPTFDVIEEESA